jgi:hypothetical protein
VNNNINKTELQKSATYENLENIVRLSNLEHITHSLSSYDREDAPISTGAVKSRFLAEKEAPKYVNCAE